MNARSGAGAVGVALPIPGRASWIGQRLHAQWFWLEPVAPSPCAPLGLAAYRRRRVVDHVHLEVAEGEIVGLLGPNAALGLTIQQ